MSRNIGIVGFGFVGQAVYTPIKDKNEVYIYDDRYGNKNIHTLKTECDTIFVCLPTPMNEDGSQDTTAIDAFFTTLDGFSGVVVIKSTVLYSNIEKYIGRYDIVMNPEFLNANTAHEDFINQHLIILGGNITHTSHVKDVYFNRFNLDIELEVVFCSHEEAIDAKYMHNIYHAYKVLFWNFCQELTGNARKMFGVYSKITGNTNEMARICADGKPGYGGACFPKDVNALEHNSGHELLTFMKNYNKKLRD